MANDPLYAAYVLVLVLGLRRGEVLGLTWDDVRTAAAELHITRQLQRVSGDLLHSRDQDRGISQPSCRYPISAWPRSSSAARKHDRAREAAGPGLA